MCFSVQGSPHYFSSIAFPYSFLNEKSLSVDPIENWPPNLLLLFLLHCLIVILCFYAALIPVHLKRKTVFLTNKSESSIVSRNFIFTHLLRKIPNMLFDPQIDLSISVANVATWKVWWRNLWKSNIFNFVDGAMKVQPILLKLITMAWHDILMK